MSRRLPAATLMLPCLAAWAAPHYALNVKLEPAKGEATVAARIVLPAGEAVSLRMDGRYAPDDGLLDGQPHRAIRDRDTWRIDLPPGAHARRLDLNWRVAAPAADGATRHRDTLTDASPRIGVAGSFLPAGGGWYPLPYDDAGPQLHRYTLDIDLPETQRALVPGERTHDRVQSGRRQQRFEARHDGEGADLMAGPWLESTRTMRARDGRPLVLRTLFHAGLADLAEGYLDATAASIARFEEKIGDYPYGSFSIASSPTPTGFGMAGLTYLGIDVLRLPFIRHTSLPHEVLHNWWGNGVFLAHDSGNWSEGLTTFMADHAQREAQGADAARALRLDWLRALSALPPASERSLAEFAGRTHDASQVIGYNKSALVFLMLRDLLGEATFDRALRHFWREMRYRRAGWADLQRAFEQASERDLGRHFAQWVDGRGLAAPRIASVRPLADGVEVTLEQATPPYPLQVRLAALDADGQTRKIATVDLPDALTRITVPLAACTDLALDPDLRLARRLAPGEAPPILREATLDDRLALTVLGNDAAFAAAADALVRDWLDGPPRKALETDAPGAAARMVIGRTADLDRWLSRHGLPKRPEDGEVVAWAARSPAGGTLALIAARDADALALARRALPHYGSQGWVVLKAGRASARGQWPAATRHQRVCPAGMKPN